MPIPMPATGHGFSPGTNPPPSSWSFKAQVLLQDSPPKFCKPSANISTLLQPPIFQFEKLEETGFRFCGHHASYKYCRFRQSYCLSLRGRPREEDGTFIITTVRIFKPSRTVRNGYSSRSCPVIYECAGGSPSSPSLATWTQIAIVVRMTHTVLLSSYNHALNSTHQVREISPTYHDVIQLPKH
jgi:hypothetical protein